MDKLLRKAQNDILKIFAKEAEKFALAGGTALELFYLEHRFSVDLDFFSPDYDLKEIDKIASGIKKSLFKNMKLEAEFVTNDDKAKVKFYTASVPGSDRPIKIDFVEDVVFKNPKINKLNGLRVYGAEVIYLMKLLAITGTNLAFDEIGKEVSTGRREARDIFDIYMLSRKIKPLHLFLKKTSPQVQRGVIHWYRTFSRQDCKLALLDLDIYDKNFDSREMIDCLEKEIEKFMKETME